MARKNNKFQVNTEVSTPVEEETIVAVEEPEVIPEPKTTKMVVDEPRGIYTRNEKNGATTGILVHGTEVEIESVDGEWARTVDGIFLKAKYLK